MAGMAFGPVATISSGVSSFASVQDAYDSLDHTGTIAITAEYDESVEDFPIVMDGGPGTRVTSPVGGYDHERATITNDSGESTFVLDQGNNRMPNTTVRDLSILQLAGGSGIEVRDSSHNYFENVHIDGNNTDTDVLWDFGSATEEYGNNSQRLFYCTAEEGGSHGFEFGAKAHDVRGVGCSALHCAGIGWFVNGPSSVSLRGGQLENCGENGARVRACYNATIKDTYVEHNAPDPDLSPADIHVSDNAVATTIADNYFNGSNDGMPYAIWAEGSAVDIEGNRFGVDYETMAYVAGSDVDIHAGSNTIDESTSVAEITDAAQRVRSHGTIIGAGSDHGGEGDLGGVYPEEVDGLRAGDEARSRSHRTVWFDGEWQ